MGLAYPEVAIGWVLEDNERPSIDTAVEIAEYAEWAHNELKLIQMTLDERSHHVPDPS